MHTTFFPYVEAILNLPPFPVGDLADLGTNFVSLVMSFDPDFRRGCMELYQQRRSSSLTLKKLQISRNKHIRL